MAINRLNYEEYLADYLDSNLDPVLSAELMVFLSENPDLERQYRELEARSHSMPAETSPCPHKESLKKDFPDVEAVQESNVDEFCIAAIEGLLKDEDRQRLLRYIDLHPQRAEDFKRYEQTILRPDFHLSFPGKEMLKKALPIRSRYNGFRNILRIAAVIAALVMVIAINPGERSGKLAYMNGFLSTHTNPWIEAAGKSTTNIEIRETPSKFATDIEKKVAIAPDKPETMAYLPLISNIAASLLPNPHRALPPVEKSLVLQPVIPGNNELTASLPERKKTGSDIPDLLGLVRKVDIWKTAGKIVDGFNYLTESRIQFYSTLDDQGKMSDLIITAEAFSVVSHKNN